MCKPTNADDICVCGEPANKQLPVACGRKGLFVGRNGPQGTRAIDISSRLSSCQRTVFSIASALDAGGRCGRRSDAQVNPRSCGSATIAVSRNPHCEAHAANKSTKTSSLWRLVIGLCLLLASCRALRARRSMRKISMLRESQGGRDLDLLSPQRKASQPELNRYIPIPCDAAPILIVIVLWICKPMFQE